MNGAESDPGKPGSHGSQLGLTEEDAAARLRTIADDLDGGRRARADGGAAATPAAHQVPDGPEIDLLNRVWPLSARQTMLAGGALGVAGFLTPVVPEVGGLVGGLVLLGGSIEIARSEGRRAA